MSNPNWPDDSQLFPGTPPQQPEQPSNPAPYPTVPSAPPLPDPSFGQPMMPPAAPFGQPAPADPFAPPGASPFGAPPPTSPGYGQQPSSPNLYGTTQVSAPFGAPPAGDPYAPQPSAPLPPYGYPGAPSQPLSGYQGTPSQGFPGYTGPPSQGMAGYPGMPSQMPYGQPGAPSMPMYSQPQWGPPSQGFPGGMAEPRPKRSKKPLIIALSIVAVLLLLVGGGAAYVVTSLGAPAAAATQLCGALKTQNYAVAYGLFSSNLRDKYSSDLFTQGAQALDQVEGTVTQCDKASGNNAYSYSFGASTATLQAVITRSKQGQLTGQITLTNEGGSWKVDALDTSLLGVNLGALQVVNGLCQALQAKDYATAYGLFGANPQGIISESDFAANAKLDDQYDGPLTACSLVSIGLGNTDTTTTLTVSVTRTKPGPKSGQITLDVESGAWKISTIAPAILGTDYRPLLVAEQFCSDYKSNHLQAAYQLMSSDSGVSQSDFITYFQLPSDLKLVGCTPQLSSYQVTGSSASLRVVFKITQPSTGASVNVNADFKFTLEGSSWKISDLPNVTLA